jgi:hypothetical protein
MKLRRRIIEKRNKGNNESTYTYIKLEKGTIGNGQMHNYHLTI